MKIKKILSLVLASIMVLALAVPAFAVDDITPNVTDITKGANVKIAGSTEAPTIRVSVPTSAKLIANPYALTVKKTDENGLDADSTAKVISPTQFIQSQSNIDLYVSGTITGTPSTEVKLLSADKADDDAWTAASKSKEMFLYFVMKENTTVGTKISDTTAYSADDASQMIVQAKATPIPAAMAAQAKLGKATITDGTADKTTEVAFRLMGKLTSNLATGTWTDKDKVDVAIAFTFLPTAPAVPTT